MLPVLRQREDVVVTTEGTPLAYAEVEEAPLISVSASDSSGDAAPGDWFDLGITVSVAGEEVPFAPLFAALVRGDGHLILDTGTWFSLDRPELRALRRLIEEARSLQDRDSGTLRVTRLHAGLWEELVSLGVVAHQSERWSRTVGALLDLKTVPTPPCPTGLTAELRDYQTEGYQWLRSSGTTSSVACWLTTWGWARRSRRWRWSARAHELGTLTPEAPLLIATPTSVVSTWQREAARFCPDLRVAAVTETRKRSGQPLAEATAGAHLVVTSFALLRLDEDAFREVSWSGLVLDEAQFVKNHQAKTYQVARRLPAPFKLAITGTPLGELAHGPVVAAVDRGARALPESAAVHRALPQADRERRVARAARHAAPPDPPADAPPDQGAGGGRPPAQAWSRSSQRAAEPAAPHGSTRRTCSGSASGSSGCSATWTATGSRSSAR